MKGAYYTKQYRNVFAECGHSQEEIDKKLKDASTLYFMARRVKSFILKPGMTWGILRIQEILMPEQKVCLMP